MLGDGNEVTQEMASRGISVVYAMSGPAARKELLDDLVGVLQGGLPAPAPVSPPHPSSITDKSCWADRVCLCAESGAGEDRLRI